MKSRICDLLNIEYPIFQGAMAHISESTLCASVSEAGGLGIIAGGNAPIDYLRGEIQKVKAKTNKPFAVNIMLLSDNVEELVNLVCEEKVPVVTTGAGNPDKYIDKFKENGIKVIPIVASVALAKRMERMGVDAIIAEGMEAGGHIGKLTTMPLIPQIVDAVDVPVIAAGGIGDGRGCVAAFGLGAEAVQVGTRFLVSTDCVIHENYKAKVLKAKDIDTTTTGDITGHPVRVLKNKLVREYLKIEKEELAKDKPDLERIEALGRGALAKAVREGDVEYGSLMSGQIAGLVNKEECSKKIIDSLVSEFDAIVSNFVKFI